MSLYIQDIAYHLPEKLVSNDDLERENPRWHMAHIGKHYGVQTRHIADQEETAVDLAVLACSQLFQRHPDLPGRIDALIVCTQSPDYIMPPNACVLHKALDLSEKVMAFDFNLGCSGFVYGLAIIQGLLTGHLAHNILFVTGDTYSRYIHPNDRSPRVLFGDGVAATWITSAPTGHAGLIDTSCATMGASYEKFIIPAGACRQPKSVQTALEQVDKSGNVRTAEHIFMDGKGLMEFVLAKVPDQVRDLLGRNKMNTDMVDLFLFHQASKLALDSLTRSLLLPPDKVFQNIAQIGNTVSASIPIAMRDALDTGRLQRGQKIVVSGFGVGLSWASAILEF